MLRLDKYQHQRAKADHQKHRSLIIDAALQMMRLLVIPHCEYGERDDTYREIDPEHRWPSEKGGKKRAEDRTCHGRHAPDDIEITLYARSLVRRIDVTDDGVSHWSKRPRAQPLEAPENDEFRHRPGEAAQNGSHEKNAWRAHNDPFTAVEIGEPAIDRRRYRLRQ